MKKKKNARLFVWHFFLLLLERCHHPIQEERIFMFVDVKPSTTLAELPGDILYNKLLQNLF